MRTRLQEQRIRQDQDRSGYHDGERHGIARAPAERFQNAGTFNCDGGAAIHTTFARH
jgi:hypothetical protein